MNNHKKVFSAIAFFLLISSCSSPGNSTESYTNLSAIEGAALIKENTSNKDFIIIDVRTLAEYNDAHIKNAVLIDFYSDSFKTDILKLDKNKTYFVYCRSGNRSGQAAAFMKNSGFKIVYNLKSGIREWIAKGLPVE